MLGRLLRQEPFQFQPSTTASSSGVRGPVTVSCYTRHKAHALTGCRAYHPALSVACGCSRYLSRKGCEAAARMDVLGRYRGR